MSKAAAKSTAPAKQSKADYEGRSKPSQIRESNIVAAKSVASAIRTSLGPRGMDKMIQEGKGEVTITNDGATILKQMKVIHPAAKMLVELSKAQDIEAGDGTTSVVVLAGSMLEASQKLLSKGIHPTIISESFQRAAARACNILDTLATPVDMTDRQMLMKIASTSLNSKVVSQYSSVLAPIAVNAVLSVCGGPDSVSLNDIRVVKKLGGTVEDTEMIPGLLLDHKTCSSSGGVHRMEKARIGLIQFCISPPKTDMENTVVLNDYTQMDRVLKEERMYILNIVKEIKKAGCNVLFIQKSILRDAVNDLALHFLAKMKILVVKDIERDEVEFICKTLNCRPIASLDHFNPDMLGTAELVEEVQTGSSKITKVTGIQNQGKTMSILVRGSNKLVLDEAERSLHDALCVIRCLVKKKQLIPGGGAPEIELSQQLTAHSNTLAGIEQYCVRAFAQSLEIIPYTLAENAGLNAIQTVTELRNRHANGEKTAGINVRKGAITNILDESVLQPLLVSSSAVSLAAETVRCILKIDDVEHNAPA
uniref:T-complex protein 1 subunit delta n=1 Tax=Macrostomum lignano TaxID=282301 RepID=A0A1I8G6Y3_9PLAT